VNPYPTQPGGSDTPSRLPSKDRVEYCKLVLELLMLLLAVPWILRELARNPRAASRRAAAKHLAGA
jgi:hypothetical protein